MHTLRTHGTAEILCALRSTEIELLILHQFAIDHKIWNLNMQWLVVYQVVTAELTSLAFIIGECKDWAGACAYETGFRRKCLCDEAIVALDGSGR